MNKLSKSGIYKQNCGDCNASYIARTCRTRLSEHIGRPTIHLKFNLIRQITTREYLKLDLYEYIEI